MGGRIGSRWKFRRDAASVFRSRELALLPNIDPRVDFPDHDEENEMKAMSDMAKPMNDDVLSTRVVA